MMSAERADSSRIGDFRPSESAVRAFFGVGRGRWLADTGNRNAPRRTEYEGYPLGSRRWRRPRRWVLRSWPGSSSPASLVGAWREPVANRGRSVKDPSSASQRHRPARLRGRRGHSGGRVQGLREGRPEGLQGRRQILRGGRREGAACASGARRKMSAARCTVRSTTTATLARTAWRRASGAPRQLGPWCEGLLLHAPRAETAAGPRASRCGGSRNGGADQSSARCRRSSR